MGEDRRRRLLVDVEWPRLYPGLPARAAIFRPPSRSSLFRQYESEFAARIAAALAAGRPSLCFNTECDNELHALPTVMISIRTADDPSVPPIATGACETCARQDDAGVREMMRGDWPKIRIRWPARGMCKSRDDYPGRLHVQR